MKIVIGRHPISLKDINGQVQNIFLNHLDGMPKMTEEDTFKVLKRIPIEELKRLICELSIDVYYDNEKFFQFCSKHGWAEDELVQLYLRI